MADTLLGSFPADVAARFAFLADDFGFTGPSRPGETCVRYALGPWTILVILDMDGKTVDTYVNHDAGGRMSSGCLWPLVTKARVRGAGQARSCALTRADLQKSLSAQAAALRLLMPPLLTVKEMPLLGG